MILGPDSGEWWDARMDAATQTAEFRARNNWLRASLAGRIEVLVPDETDPETRRLYADERADYREG